MKSLGAYLAALVAAAVLLAGGGFLVCIAGFNNYTGLAILAGLVTVVAAGFAARTVARWLLPKVPP